MIFQSVHHAATATARPHGARSSDAVLQQVRGKAVPQRMRRHPGAQARCLRRHLAAAVELPCRDRQQRIAAREQPASRAALQPPRARSSSCGESIACRSFSPLPCSTRISMRLESISLTRSIMTGGCTPLSVRCTWKRRTSSAVAVAGKRPTKLVKASTWRRSTARPRRCASSSDRAELARHLARVHYPRKLPRVLSPEEVGRLLEAAPGPGLKYRAALAVGKK